MKICKLFHFFMKSVRATANVFHRYVLRIELIDTANAFFPSDAFHWDSYSPSSGLEAKTAEDLPPSNAASAGPISIEILSFSLSNELTPTKASRKKASKMASAARKKSSQTPPTTGSFVPDKACAEKGVLHLYRERDPVSVHEWLKESAESGNKNSQQPLLAMLAVPSYMSPRELLNFIGAYQQSIRAIRLIRDSLPNRYLVVLKMKDFESSESFLEDFNGV